MKFVLSAAFIAAAFSLPSAMADVTAISSSLELHAEANAGIGLIQSNQLVSQTTTLNGLSASVFAQAINGSKKATAQSSGSATWSSASTGQFSLDTLLKTDNLSAFHDARVATGSPGWIYTFTSDLPATLTLNYGTTYTGGFAYSALLFINQMVDNSLVIQHQFAVPSSGSFAFSISPNQTNTFQIFDNSNLNQNLPALTSHLTATFAYQIDAIPEPASFALVVLGATALLLVSPRKSAFTRSH